MPRKPSKKQSPESSKFNENARIENAEPTAPDGGEVLDLSQVTTSNTMPRGFLCSYVPTESLDPYIEDLIALSTAYGKCPSDWGIDSERFLDIFGSPGINSQAIQRFISFEPDNILQISTSFTNSAENPEAPPSELVARAINLTSTAIEQIHECRKSLLERMNFETFCALRGVLARRHRAKFSSANTADIKPIDYLPPEVLQRESEISYILFHLYPEIDKLVSNLVANIRKSTANAFPRFPCSLIRAIEYVDDKDLSQIQLKRSFEEAVSRFVFPVPVELNEFQKLARTLSSSTGDVSMKPIQQTSSNSKAVLKSIWNSEDAIKNPMTLLWIHATFPTYLRHLECGSPLPSLWR